MLNKQNEVDGAILATYLNGLHTCCGTVTLINLNLNPHEFYINFIYSYSEYMSTMQTRLANHVTKSLRLSLSNVHIAMYLTSFINSFLSQLLQRFKML